MKTLRHIKPLLFFRRTHLLLAALLTFALPAIAWACPVCYSSGQKESQWAYYAMTIFLSLMPFFLFGIFGIWVYRNYVKPRRN